MTNKRNEQKVSARNEQERSPSGWMISLHCQSRNIPRLVNDASSVGTVPVSMFRFNQRVSRPEREINARTQKRQKQVK